MECPIGKAHYPEKNDLCTQLPENNLTQMG